MSRAALEVERAVKEMRSRAAKEERQGRRTEPAKGGKAVNANEQVGNEKVEGEGENQLTRDTDSVMTDSTNLTGQEGSAGGNDAAGAPERLKEGKRPVAKKAKKAKAPKAPKAATKGAKPAAGEKKERKPRSKVVASGALRKVEASGTTYITLEFEEGKIVLTPTGNRETNRDIAVKALRSLLKG